MLQFFLRSFTLWLLWIDTLLLLCLLGKVFLRDSADFVEDVELVASDVHLFVIIRVVFLLLAEVLPDHLCDE